MTRGTYEKENFEWPSQGAGGISSFDVSRHFKNRGKMSFSIHNHNSRTPDDNIHSLFLALVTLLSSLSLKSLIIKTKKHLPYFSFNLNFFRRNMT